MLDVISDDQLSALYGRGYYEGESNAVYQSYLADKETKSREFAERLDQIERVFRPSPGSCLEVGCAFGLFLDQARHRGWNVRGTEISAHSARWAREQLGLPVDNAPDAVQRVPSASQDLVALWDVIEHVKEPRSLLRDLRRTLKRGGLLAMSTGDVGSWNARIFGRRWHLIAPPYHLFYFAHESIGRLLHDAEFKIERIENRGGHFLLNGHDGLLSSLARRDRYIDWRLKRGAPIMHVFAIAV